MYFVFWGLLFSFLIDVNKKIYGHDNDNQDNKNIDSNAQEEEKTWEEFNRKTNSDDFYDID